MEDNFEKIGSVFLAGSSWIISLGDVEETLRIVALLITTTLSILVFLKNKKRDKDGKK